MTRYLLMNFANFDSKFLHPSKNLILSSVSSEPSGIVQNVMRVVEALSINAKITMCGTIESGYCRDCLNCERFYYQAMERQQ